jgi:tRNA G18 (ribose-2'-O)-methylase SpoU
MGARVVAPPHTSAAAPVRRLAGRPSYNSRTAVYEEMVYGIHPALAVLRLAPRRVAKAYVLSGGRAVEEAGVLRALREAQEERSMAGAVALHVVRTDRSQLDSLSRGATHQGIVLLTDQLQPLQLPYGLSPADFTATFCKAQAAAAAADGAADERGATPPRAPLLVALDDVTDPHNVGAVLRSALLLDADGILLSGVSSGQGEGGNAVTGATVAKTSAGALEVWAAAGRLFHTPSLPTLLGSWGAAGWRVLGTALPGLGGGGPPSVPFSDLRRSGAAGTVVIVGNEGAGVRGSILKACTAVTCIPMAAGVQRLALSAAASRAAPRGGTPAAGLPVDSLNVGVATALLLQQLR